MSALLTSNFVSNFSFSGNNIFAATIAAGADIADAANKCLANIICWTGSSPPKKPIYAAKTPPAIVAIPPLIKHNISDMVILSKYGFTSSGDSVCPKKIFPAAATLSGPDRRIIFFMSQAKP